MFKYYFSQEQISVTEELIRKRAEHNEKIIGTLEELSLHQEDIEKIEHLHNWCKEIQILYLQANLIGKIENLNKLKKLQYLNLAINNIEKIGNLSRCESLEKLDLTLNFIGDLESISSLANNIHLKYLYLTGNPCCDYPSYRNYVIGKLPQITTLDSSEITKSERIKATQNVKQIEKDIQIAQNKYFQYREAQKHRIKSNNNPSLDDEEFWKSTSEHSPETRIEMAYRSRRAKGLDKEVIKPKKGVTLFKKNGAPLNMNQAKLEFKLIDEYPDKLILDLAVYKYLDTSLIDVDLQSIYVRITVKEKIFQIVFPEEIAIDKSTCKRSQVTGHLVLEMPRANYKPLKHEECVVKRSATLEPRNES